MFKVRMNRGAVHIAFHYVPERIEILEKTIGYLRTWEVSCVDIFVHSNIEDPGVFMDVTWVLHHDLEHPFALTWLPVETIKTQLDQYDFFGYLEDDVGIPKAAFGIWKRYPSPQLGFIRKNIITGEYDDIVSAGLSIHTAFVETSSPEFVGFSADGFLYKAFWLNTNHQMREYLTLFESHVMTDIRRNFMWSRERAAIGNTVWFKSVFLRNELENSIVWHLSPPK